MKRPLRTILLLVVAVLAVLASACGVEAGSTANAPDVTSSDDPGTTTDEPGTDKPETDDPSEDPPESTDPSRQTVIDTYVELGFTQDEAECLTDALLGLMDDSGPVDNSGIMDAVNQCDIPISRLADIGEAAGGSTEDGMRLGLETSLKNQGLSASEATCVADEYIAEFGTDISKAQDPAALADLLEACGLTIDDLGN